MEKISFTDIKDIVDSDMEKAYAIKEAKSHLLATTNDGVSLGSMLSNNYSWCWTSMVNMEKGVTPSTNNTHAINNMGTSSFSTPKQMTPYIPMQTTMAKIPSSNLQNQHLDNMATHDCFIANNAYSTDNSTWSQEFLNGLTYENNPCNIYHLECSNEGLHDLLSPRKLLEPSLSNEMIVEKIPSWLDNLMPIFPYFQNNDINNQSSKSSIACSRQNQRNDIGLIENCNDESMIQSDIKKMPILINHHNLQANLNNHKSTNATSFSQDMKSDVLDNQDYLQFVNHSVGSKVSPSTNHSQCHSIQASSHYGNRDSKVPKRKNQPQENNSSKKPKFGEKIMTLQQLVSPYGKADQASVLMEAMKCIKFLQEKLQTLSSPYIKTSTLNKSEDESQQDLKSKGLCLVPFTCTLQLVTAKGEDTLYSRVFR